MSESDKPAVWKGWLQRGDAPGTVVGELRDSWGWVVSITGTLDRENGGYTLEGRLGDPPAALRIPIVDDVVDKPG